MDKPKHTEGPWTVAQPYAGFSAIRGGAGELIFGIAAGGIEEKQPDDVCEANARLIAAAPELYEALKDAAKALDQAACVARVYKDEDWALNAEVAARRARFSIAKAEGK